MCPQSFKQGMKATAWFAEKTWVAPSPLGNYKVIAQTTVAVLIRMTIETFW